jgi:hypothetical protein
VVVAVALGAFGFEGTIKANLVARHAGYAVALGAFLLDLGLALAVAVVLHHGVFQSAAGLWRRLSLSGRVALALLGAWLVASVPQVFQSGHVVAGLDGFRLTQAYAVLAVAGAVAASICDRRTLVTALLAAFGIVAAYGALRTAVGPSSVERAFALTRPGVHTYGSVFRAVGSFSGAVGMASYMVPVAIFAFGLAVLGGYRRQFAALVFVLASAAAIGTYSRAAVVGLVAGVLVVLVIGIRTAPAARRRAVVAIVVATLVAAGVAIAVASLAAPETRTRAAGLVDPVHDESMKLRFATWRHAGAKIADHPFGTGLGTVGRASQLYGPLVTADNSYLKILLEQGPIGGAIFVLGLLATVVATARQLGRVREEERALGVGALAAVVGFLAMAVFGEFVEQPGKVVFWTLLGIAVAVATGTQQMSTPPDVDPARASPPHEA